MTDMLIGAEVVEVHPCGVKPAMLLYKGGLWLVYRTGVRCFVSEQSARKCLCCMLERRGRRPLGCRRDGTRAQSSNVGPDGRRKGAKPPQPRSCGHEGKAHEREQQT